MTKRAQRKGDYLVVCDLSGQTFWASETVKTWRGTRVARRFVGQETSRHPQDFVAAVRDDPSVPDPRPPGTFTFRSSTAVTPHDL